MKLRTEPREGWEEDRRVVQERLGRVKVTIRRACRMMVWSSVYVKWYVGEERRDGPGSRKEERNETERKETGARS